MAKRTLKEWNALSRSQQNRWKQAYGAQAVAQYRAGAPLSLRGHTSTPDRPSQALNKPFLFPRYAGQHQEQLNEIARRRGKPTVGGGTVGDSATDYTLAGGDYTYVVPEGTLDGRLGWREAFRFYFRHYTLYGERMGITDREGALRAAQLYARTSGAPPGVVIIQEEKDGYGVWFGYDPGQEHGFRKSRK
jgi:hypothetical protein